MSFWKKLFGTVTQLASRQQTEVMINAAYRGDKETIKAMLDKGVNVNTRKINGDTALIVASMKGHLEVVLLLTENEVDINACNNKGWSALSLASYHGHAKVVNTLLEKGVDMIAQGNEKALMYAFQNDHLDVAQMLKNHIWQEQKLQEKHPNAASTDPVRMDNIPKESVKFQHIRTTKKLMLRQFFGIIFIVIIPCFVLIGGLSFFLLGSIPIKNWLIDNYHEFQDFNNGTYSLGDVVFPGELINIDISPEGLTSLEGDFRTEDRHVFATGYEIGYVGGNEKKVSGSGGLFATDAIYYKYKPALSQIRAAIRFHLPSDESLLGKSLKISYRVKFVYPLETGDGQHYHWVDKDIENSAVIELGKKDGARKIQIVDITEGTISGALALLAAIWLIKLIFIHPKFKRPSKILPSTNDPTK